MMKIGETVQLWDGSRRCTRRGLVIELDDVRKRARVKWEVGPRTWCKYSRLAVVIVVEREPVFEVLGEEVGDEA